MSQQAGQTWMAESWRCTRIRAGQRWLQAAVEAVLAQASMPLAARAAHQSAVYWEPRDWHTTQLVPLAG